MCKVLQFLGHTGINASYKYIYRFLNPVDVFGAVASKK